MAGELSLDSLQDIPNVKDPAGVEIWEEVVSRLNQQMADIAAIKREIQRQHRIAVAARLKRTGGIS